LENENLTKTVKIFTCLTWEYVIALKMSFAKVINGKMSFDLNGRNCLLGPEVS
jgi:hypothetical protein